MSSRSNILERLYAKVLVLPDGKECTLRDVIDKYPELASPVERIASTTACKQLEAEYDFDTQPSLTDCKIGGYPYLPQEAEVPRDLSGTPLTLLAQINCEQLPENRLYPQEGILQFWVGRDDIFGLEPYELTGNRNSRVIYYETVDSGLREEDVHDRYTLPLRADGAPWEDEDAQGVKLVFTLEDAYVGNSTPEFYSLCNELLDDAALADRLKNQEDFGEVFSMVMAGAFDWEGVRLGGYPAFGQGDPRGESDDYADYTVQLLGIGTDDVVEYAEMADITFLIRPADLERRDFSRVLYTWDCILDEEVEG